VTTDTTQNKTTRDEHPCPQRDSNTWSQQSSTCRPTIRLHGHRDPLKTDNWNSLWRYKDTIYWKRKRISYHVTIKRTGLITLGKRARYFAHIVTSYYQLHSAKISRFQHVFIASTNILILLLRIVQTTYF